MNVDNRSADRESIWGINSKDRRWFQLMTLLGGAGGSATLIWLTLRYRADDTPDVVAFSILLAIGASFLAAGRVRCLVVVAGKGDSNANRRLD